MPGATARPRRRTTLLSLVYGELRSLAAGYLRRERANHSLEATALVHEAYLRLVDNTAPWRDRAHFFGVAAQAMRRILVDHARKRQASERGPGGLQVTLDEAVGVPERDVDLLNLDLSLRALTALDARQGQIVELRFFGGLSVEETAEYLAISPATVKREWVTARAFMLRELRRGGVDDVVRRDTGTLAARQGGPGRRSRARRPGAPPCFRKLGMSDPDLASEVESLIASYETEVRAARGGPCRGRRASLRELAWVPTKWATSSAGAAWARSTGPATRAWGATWRSRCCPPASSPIATA